MSNQNAGLHAVHDRHTDVKHDGIVIVFRLLSDFVYSFLAILDFIDKVKVVLERFGKSHE